MNKAINLLKILFYVSVIFLIFYSLYPGNIFGLIVYGDLKKTPYIFNHSIETLFAHFIYYFYLSLLGFYIYFKTNNFKFFFFLILLLSVVLEVFQLIIPNRAFQLYDLISNIFGVLLAFYLTKFFQK